MIQLFPSVARIPDAMLRRIDTTNPILVQYLASINTTVSVGVLLPKGAEGSSKVVKESKKKKQIEQSKPIQEHAEEEVSKEVFPSKTGILKCTKRTTKRPHHSPIRPLLLVLEVDTTAQPHHETLHTHSLSKGIKKICKP